MSVRFIAGLAVVSAFAVLLAVFHREHRVSLRLTEQRLEMPADGRMHRLGLVTISSGGKAVASDLAVSGLVATLMQAGPHAVEVSVRSPVMPGERTVRIAYSGAALRERVNITASAEDSVGDGTPDFLRLHMASDRAAFRAWFTALAESAADLPPGKLPPEISDCAALLRWCYRNALHVHDETWLRGAPAPLDLTLPSVGQYAYPQTPLGAALFRVQSGPYAADDATDGTFAQFADAHTLWRFNTFLVGRTVRSAQPGDLLFFQQLEQNSPYHSMIVTGRTERWVVYHTGPIGRGPGEMRRVLLQDLLTHPDPRWRPVPENSNFLGVYRWNILYEDPR